MSNKFETLDDVNEYQKLHGGVEPLRAMLAQDTLRPPRKEVVEAFLKHYDAAQYAAEERERAKKVQAAQLEQVELQRRQTEAAERQTIAAERQAAAAEDGSKSAWWSGRFAIWGAIITLLGIGVSLYLK